MNDLQELRSVTHGLSLLYVEDNAALRKNATKLLKKIFTQVDTAENGAIGLELFKKNHYSIVITDIKMPQMDGISLAKHIRVMHPPTKIIIMSAFDDKEYLLKIITLGIFGFLKKPVNVTQLTKTLQKAVTEIKQEQYQKMFYMHLQNIFNYQSSMVAMIHGNKITIANEMFSEFFQEDNSLESPSSMLDICANFLPHDGFLYTHDDVNVLQILHTNPQKLFHIKLKDKSEKIRHFIMKFQRIPQKDDYGILSFDDVTELNLLKLFDEKQSDLDLEQQNSEALFDLLGVIQRNSAKITLHSYYKGLSITNDGIITKIENQSLYIKTNYIQLKAIQLENKLHIVSDALPYTLFCQKIIKMSFEKQEVELQNFRFVKTSPITRKTIRVVPDEKQSASLFIGENKFHGDVIIEDISLDGVKLQLNALPAGLEVDDEVTLDIVLELDKKPIIINTPALMLRKSESKHFFHLVFLFKNLKKSLLMKYITKRQMALIRELKGKQNG